MQITIINDEGRVYSFGYDTESDYTCLPDDAPISNQQAYAIMDGRAISGWRRVTPAGTTIYATGSQRTPAVRH